MAKHFRTRKPLLVKMRYVLMILLVLITLLSVQLFLFVERNLEPALKEIAKTHVQRLATLAITDAISKKISEDMGENNLIVIEKDKEERIQLISFDQSRQAKILTQVTEQANQTLMQLSADPIRIPFGVALNSNILAQLGPDIPITFVPLGAAKADLETRLNQAGINVVSIELYLKIVANVRIVIPFSSEPAEVTTEFPIEVHVLPGDVPNYYFKSGDGSALPIPHLPNEQ